MALPAPVVVIATAPKAEPPINARREIGMLIADPPL